MALHPDFPKSPYQALLPEQRWFPAAEEMRSTAYEKLLPPLVANIRKDVTEWRDTDYAGASATSRALLNWWFKAEHLTEQADGTLTPFRYYFAQREAVETIIWLHDVRNVRDKFDLLRFDSSGAVSANMFDEDWPRYVVKMATGAGKTKVISLLLAWSYFHKLYEADSTLARNFLVIAPNIIVLDRLRADFDGLKIFFNDPILPDNGHEGQSWRDDFQMTLHIQDDVRVARDTGNIFLTNIHRVYLRDVVCDLRGDRGQLIKVSKDKQGVITDEVLTKHWTDWVDYWAVDFDYMSRKEIIRVPVGSGQDGSLPGFEPPQGELALPEFEERWTGSYIFENEWQSFRTRRDRSIELTSAAHTYLQQGRYTVAVKVIAIFGNDTMVLVPVNVG